MMSFLSRLRSSEHRAGQARAELPVELHPAGFLRDRTPDAPVLDVRTAAEYNQQHISGAVNLDILDDRFMDRIADLDMDPDAPLYLYCRTGNRSGHAARILRQNGYARAFNVGGLDDLVREGAESEP
jgi:phage shock protein E